MSETSRLSPMTSYYLRKFVADRQDFLHEIVPDLHGEITLDRLFNRMDRHGWMTEQRMSVIESLVDIHKKVTKNAPPESMQVQNLDNRILASLGIEGTIPQQNPTKTSISVAKDCVEVLNSLLTQALFYLGDNIGTKYLIETRPTEQWCQQFKVAPRSKVTYEGKLDENLNPEQVTYFETWIDHFSHRCGDIMSGFNRNGSPRGEALFEDL